MEIVAGKIVDITPQGKLIIEAHYDNLERVLKRKYETVEVGLLDSREISTNQRKCIHSILNSIADWQGELPAWTKRLFKIKFLTEQFKGLEKKLFSLSNCDMTIACDFTKYLIDFVLYYDVPLDFNLLEFLGDSELEHYLYACLKHKKCCICGRKTELHHVDHVGMGNDRDEIIHEGMEVLPLCHNHHFNEIHIIGDKAFKEKHHIPKGIILDKELCKIYNLKARKANEL